MIDVIGLSGKAGSGKDFIGRTVLRSAGYHQWAFAWPIKMLAIGRGATYEEVFVTKPPLVRNLLQKLGTEQGWMEYGRDYWVDQAEGYLHTLRENLGLDKFYFTDVRFPHEVKWIRRMGGKVVRVVGRGGLTDGTEGHTSETALDDWTDWDLIVNNAEGTTRGDLTAQMDSLLPRRYSTPKTNEWVAEVVPLTINMQGVLGRWPSC